MTDGFQLIPCRYTFSTNPTMSILNLDASGTKTVAMINIDFSSSPIEFEVSSFIEFVFSAAFLNTYDAATAFVSGQQVPVRVRQTLSLGVATSYVVNCYIKVAAAEPIIVCYNEGGSAITDPVTFIFPGIEGDATLDVEVNIRIFNQWIVKGDQIGSNTPVFWYTVG